MRNSFVPMAECSLHPGDRFYNINAIRKTVFGLPKFCERARVVLLVVSGSEMDFRQVRIERERVIEGILSSRLSLHPLCCFGIDYLPEALDLRDREICPGQRKIRIQANLLLVQSNCTLD